MVPAKSSPRLPILLTVAGACAIVAVGWPPIFASLVSGAPVALFILLSAWGIGYVLARLLLPTDAGPAWRFIGAMGLGIGALPLFALIGGQAATASRVFWITLLAILIAYGVLAAAWQKWKSAAAGAKKVPASSDPNEAPPRWEWLAILPFLAIALMAASFPPGTLWPAEGNGYDVLEYHFGVPRDWIDAGRIGYLPQNLYGNFPMNVELLYLLSILLVGDAVDAALTAQLLNFILAVLAVAAVWLAARPWGLRAAWIAAVAVASCPFLAYLCGVAYVENGLLFFTALSLGAVFRAAMDRPNSRVWLLVTGFFAGFACGCKYTAVPAVLLPLIVASLWVPPRARSRRHYHPLIVLISALLTFSPWLARNYTNTGNPVFPLARSVFPERTGIWNGDGAARWHEGHLPAPEHRSLTGRANRLWHEIIASPHFGMTWMLAFVGVMGLVLHRRTSLNRATHPVAQRGMEDSSSAPESADARIPSRALPTTPPSAGASIPSRTIPTTLPCWIMLAVTLLTWLAFTHLVGRFAVTLIIPASIIAAVGLARLAETRRAIFVACMTVAIIGNAAALGSILLDARFFDLARLRTGADTTWFTQGVWPTHAHVPRINQLTRDGHRVLVVADARRYYLDAGADYCVVFNRNPFAEAAEERSETELIKWLYHRGYTHVYVDWSEMRRLRNSRYGFWASIDEGLFARLESAGMRRVENFHYEVEEGQRVYSTLYEVPGPVSP